MKKESSSEKSKWVIFKNITTAIILLISVRYLFDDSPFNDNIGWFLMLIFWIVKGLFDFIDEKRNGDKKSMIGSLILSSLVLVYYFGKVLNIFLFSAITNGQSEIKLIHSRDMSNRGYMNFFKNKHVIS